MKPYTQNCVLRRGSQYYTMMSPGMGFFAIVVTFYVYGICTDYVFV